MISRLINEENGQGMTEYILIIGLVAVICVVAVKTFGTQINDLINGSVGKLKKETAEVGK
ncbi:MAG: hypothetical protein A2252_09495 [Elusimicrobia bacterium RIFOXYA2_FULL_39_19]|nr:MAG: hypothetical protein A2252_09495 [Elusimicrobia bacterium RIFOXYA2_FULL_39_19]